MSVLENLIAPVAGLAAHLGRGVGRIATDAAIGRLRSMPRTVGDLDALTMSQLTGRVVTSVTVLGGDAGTSSRTRLALTGEGVPATVFVKMAAETVATRLMGELGNRADTETRFYRQLAPQLTGVPLCYGSQFDPWTGRFILVLEDLADLSNLSVAPCEFPDTLHPIDPDRAASVVELLARLHATYWERLPAQAGRGPLGWLYTASADSASMLTGPLLKTSSRRLAERTDLPLERGQFINEHYRAVAALVDVLPTP